MAEVAGLVLGTVGLAALFQSCIELFDRFELGRNFASDYRLARTKIGLLHARLSRWGGVLCVEAPGYEHPALRQNWQSEQDIIASSLNGIRDLFQNASLLAGKYDSSTSKPKTVTIGLFRKRDSVVAASGSAQVIRLPAWSSIAKRTRWAVHHKSKLDGFVQDLSFLIENLEKVKYRLAMSSTRSLAPCKPVPKRTVEESAKDGLPRHESSGRAPLPSNTQANGPKLGSSEQTRLVSELVGMENAHSTVNNQFDNTNHTAMFGNLGSSGIEGKNHIVHSNTFKNKGGFTLFGNAASGEEVSKAAQGCMISEDILDNSSDTSGGTYSSAGTLQDPPNRDSPHRGT